MKPNKNGNKVIENKIKTVKFIPVVDQDTEEHIHGLFTIYIKLIPSDPALTYYIDTGSKQMEEYSIY